LRICAAVSAIALLAAAVIVRAQASDHRLAFDVVSIKESKNPNPGGSAAFRPGGTFFATNIPASGLVSMAYRMTPQLLPQQIVGMPAWAEPTRYDITAKVAGTEAADLNALYAAQPRYVRSLLEDRFHFAARMEKRDLPVYALTAPNGTAKLRRSTLDCAKPEDRPKCFMSFDTGIKSAHIQLSNVIGNIATASGRPVVDRTGLDGFFDIDLQYASGPPTPDAREQRPSIFAAVQEQLGLKLESTQASMDVLVIDHLEKPTEN
jgi:uncharacterized protein (TIGR03435 family)